MESSRKGSSVIQHKDGMLTGSVTCCEGTCFQKHVIEGNIEGKSEGKTRIKT